MNLYRKEDGILLEKNSNGQKATYYWRWSREPDLVINGPAPQH